MAGLPTITIETIGDTLSIAAPYLEEFRARVKIAGGRWDLTKKRWILPVEALKRVKSLLVDCYGYYGPPPTDVVDLHVTVTAPVVANKMSIEMWGRVIVRGYGHQHTVKGVEYNVPRCGDLVYFPSRDKPPFRADAGSRRNWKVMIEAGAEFDVYRVPRSLYVLKHYPNVTAEILGSQPRGQTEAHRETGRKEGALRSLMFWRGKSTPNNE